MWDISVDHIFKDQMLGHLHSDDTFFYIMLFGWKVKLDKRKQLLAKCCLAYSKEDKHALICFKKRISHFINEVHMITNTNRPIRQN